jgi:hypothetical protein
MCGLLSASRSRCLSIDRIGFPKLFFIRIALEFGRGSVGWDIWTELAIASQEPIRRKTEDQSERLAWLRWEFIRRNQEYVKDWVAFDCKFGSWFEKNGYWWDNKGPIYDEHAWFLFSSKAAPAAKTICERWKIADPFPPSWEFGSNCMRKEGRATVVIPTLNGDGTRHAWNLKAIDPVLFPSRVDRWREALKDRVRNIEETWSETGDPRYLRLEIDVTESMEEIISRVERRVEFGKRFYEKRVGLLQKKAKKGHPTRIKNTEDYAGYVRVWDWRQQGKTFKEIAALEFPKEMQTGDRLNPVVDRVRAQYKRACDLMKWASEK